MIKTKGFFTGDVDGISEQINAFLEKENVKLVDVRYQAVGSSGATYHYALLVYDR